MKTNKNGSWKEWLSELSFLRQQFVNDGGWEHLQPDPTWSSEINGRGSLCCGSRDFDVWLKKHWLNLLPPLLGQWHRELAQLWFFSILSCNKSPAARSDPLSPVLSKGGECVCVGVDLQLSRYTLLTGHNQCCHAGGDRGSATVGRRTCYDLGVSSLQSEDGGILPADAHPHVCSIMSSCMHTFSWRKILFFVMRIAGKETRQLRQSLSLLCWKSKLWQGSDHAGFTLLLPADCRSMPGAKLTYQVFWGRLCPTWEDLKLCLWLWCKLLGRLEAHLRAAFSRCSGGTSTWKSTREMSTDCRVPCHNPKDIHFPMSFSSVGLLRPSIPKFSEWLLG